MQEPRRGISPRPPVERSSTLFEPSRNSVPHPKCQASSLRGISTRAHGFAFMVLEVSGKDSIIVQIKIVPVPFQYFTRHPMRDSSARPPFFPFRDICSCFSHAFNNIRLKLIHQAEDAKQRFSGDSAREPGNCRCSQSSRGEYGVKPEFAAAYQYGKARNACTSQ